MEPHFPEDDASVPERHFDVTNGAADGLNILNHCVGRSFTTTLSRFTTKQYWIQPRRCCKMYLPVHFVYKKPGTGIGILFFVQITLYIDIILNAL